MSWDLFKSYSCIWVIFLYLAIGFGVYSASFSSEWVMDDHLVIVKNPDIQSFSQFFQDSYPGRPVRELTYMLDYKLFGLSPSGYHVQNILWHVASGFLLFAVLVAMGAARWPAVFGGALFLVHPLTVEVVANISHRKDALMLAFSLAAFWLALKFFENPRRWWLGLVAAALCAVAYYAKQPAVVLPLVVLVALLIPRPGVRQFFSRRLLRELLLWSLLPICLAGWFVYLDGNRLFHELIRTGMVYLGYYDAVTPGIYFAAVAKATAFMWSRLFWPLDLAFQYQFSAPASLFDPWVWGCIAGVCLLMFGFRHGCRSNRLLAVGVAWFVLFQLPSSNLLWPLAYFAADRYQYAPLAGLIMIVVALLSRWPLVVSSRRVAGLAVTLVVVLGLLSWQQCKTWDSEMSMYRQAVKVSPDSSSALVGLAMALYNERALDEAYDYALKAAKLNQYESKAIYMLGLINEARGDLAQAEIKFRIFLQVDNGMNPQYARSAQMRLMNYQQQRQR